ncbi:MAG: PQQ-binding-like beta-propeller repeat protein, partial [Verrucomicrobia bacterium]|nr:PQQ-binding-like beta-propeller repeat protein [Verrucomicrobiota bacterium]
MDSLFLYSPGVIPVLINPIAVLLAVLPGIFMALVSLFKPKSIKAGIIMLWRMKVQVAIIAAVGYGLHWGVKTVFPQRGAEAGAAEAALVDWPHFQGSELRRSWINDGVGDPVTGGINWSFRDGNAQLFIASPAVVGNRIYIPSVTIGAFGGLSGAIYCLDADTGAQVWKGGPSDYRGSFSSAVVEGDRLVVGEGLHDTNDARAVCMDISDESDPKVIWMFQVNSHIEGTPSIDNGRVFINAGDDGVYGLDLETGEKLWHLPGEDFNDVETSILAHEGMVYVGLGFGRYGQAVIQVDGATGEVLHRIETPYPVFSPPSIHEGILYVGMGNGDFVFPAEQRVDYVLNMLREQGLSEEELEARRPGLAPGGAVWAFDIETMERVWEYETDRTILSAIAVSEQGLYFASRTGGIYHLDFEGNQLAYWNAGEPVVSSLAVAKDHVYAMTSGGMLYVLDSDTLAPVWDLRLGTGFMFFSSPAVARGQIYVGTENAGMFSVGQPDIAGSVALWSGDGGGPRRAGRADDAPLPGFGADGCPAPETGLGGAGAGVHSRTPVG